MVKGRAKSAFTSAQEGLLMVAGWPLGVRPALATEGLASTPDAPRLAGGGAA